MTIDEAIETLERWSKENCPPRLPDEFNALKLGIEALKHEKELRSKLYFLRDYRLPGETGKGE